MTRGEGWWNFLTNKLKSMMHDVGWGREGPHQCVANIHICVLAKTSPNICLCTCIQPFFVSTNILVFALFFLKMNIFVFAFLFNLNLFVISCNDTMMVTNSRDHYNIAKRENSKLEVVENFCALGIRGRHFIFPRYLIMLAKWTCRIGQGFLHIDSYPHEGHNSFFPVKVNL